MILVYFNDILTIMDVHKLSKLNNLLRNWPFGTVAVQPWLKKMKIYRQLIYRYEQYKWVERIGSGAFIRGGDKVSWIGGLYAIQKHLKKNIHIGGKTALELHGYGHFLRMGHEVPVFLYGPPGEKLPKWYIKYKWDARVVLNLVDLFPKKRDFALTQKSMGSFDITLSSPERAMMEALHLVPHEQSFEEAELLMGGLGALRPIVVQRLLEHCRSIKVKRLFMYLSEKCEHPWVSEIILSKIELGSGNRMIVRNGKLNAKYKITVVKNDR